MKKFLKKLLIWTIRTLLFWLLFESWATLMLCVLPIKPR